MEEDQVEGADGDAGIGEVEYRAEEDDPGAVADDREEQHIHHLAEHERGIAPDHAVEQAVDDVADGPGRDQRQAHRDARGRGILLDQRAYPPDQRAAQHNAEERQQELADLAAERHPEGHALILHEGDAEPLPDHIDLVAKLHVRLDQDLGDLVDDDEHDAEQQEPFALGQLHLPLVLSLLGEHFLGLDGQGGVRHEAQALFGDELAGHAADAVGLVLDAHESTFQVLDELVLALGHLAGLLLGELECAVVLDGAERGRRVLDVVGAVMHHDLAKGVVLRLGLGELLFDNGLELSEFSIRITGFGRLINLFHTIERLTMFYLFTVMRMVPSPHSTSAASCGASASGRSSRVRERVWAET